MSETIKMTEEELGEVRAIQAKFQTKIVEFGSLYLEKMQIESTIKAIAQRETDLQEGWLAAQKLENALIDKLLKKYGEGALDMTAGTFVSDKK
jgi:hypothetical protein